MSSNLWASPSRGGVVVLYAVTIFLSAFLLFALQPIIAKVILPWFGGTAAVWTTCLLFFQALLLAGYGYSHLTTRYLSPRAQAVLHVTLLALSLASLPILPNAAWKPTPEGDPLERILLLLLVSVGPAYGMLSTTGPLLQAWFARERPGSVPYRLFALSNFGSMLALLGYPFGFEPLLPVSIQSTAFSVGYVVFAIACSAIALRAFKSQPRASASTTWGASAAKPLHWTQLVEWVVWAALASAMLLALTSDLTQNVAPIPLLWVLPLAIYLLSFILCFEGSAWYQRPLFIVGALAGLIGIAYGAQPQYYHLWVPASITLHCLALFAICMVCHGELARKKPDPRHLTTFYLMVAVGGVTGGLFVGLFAPYAFNGDWEFPIVLVAIGAMIAWSVLRDPLSMLRVGRVRVAIPPLAQVLAAGGAAVAVLGLAIYSVSLVLGEAKLLVRNFYGTLRLEERWKDVPWNHSRVLFHGTIIHGFQFLNGEWRYKPTSYFTTGSGVGVGIAATQTKAPQRVGVIGLGAGTIAAYARKGDHLTFYEINGLVEDLARKHFTYLSDAPGKVDVRLGDARLVLEREAPQGYDTFVVDAFSGDAIPIHLLTLEAFQLYFRHLKPDGILAVHVSNKRLDLAPIVSLAADTLKKHAWLIDIEDDDDDNAYGSTWVLVFNRAERLSDIEVPDSTRELTRPTDLRPWTDDYSSLFHILR